MYHFYWILTGLLWNKNGRRHNMIMQLCYISCWISKPNIASPKSLQPSSAWQCSLKITWTIIVYQNSCQLVLLMSDNHCSSRDKKQGFLLTDYHIEQRINPFFPAVLQISVTEKHPFLTLTDNWTNSDVYHEHFSIYLTKFFFIKFPIPSVHFM